MGLYSPSGVFEIWAVGRLERFPDARLGRSVDLDDGEFLETRGRLVFDHVADPPVEERLTDRGFVGNFAVEWIGLRASDQLVISQFPVLSLSPS